MLQDLLYSYETTKCVRIKDRTLGLLYWTLSLLTVAYIFGYIIILDKGYLEYDNPVGIVRAALKKPTSLVIRTNHTYCTQDIECRIWDAIDIVYPRGDSDSLSITTSVTEIDQIRICDERASFCETDVYTETGKDRFNIADIENFKLKIEHSMQAEKIIFAEDDDDDDDYEPVAESSRHMKGLLISHNNTVLKKFPRNKSDRITVKALLAAADVDLDQIPDQTREKANSTHKHATMRAEGSVLFVVIHYSNSDTWFGTGAVHYEYRVHRLHDTSYVVYETLNTAEDETRHLHKRFGIHMKFMLTGKIGRFSFKALVTNVASALGLVTLSTLVVDQLALFVLPFRAQFSKFKYQEDEIEENIRKSQGLKKSQGDGKTKDENKPKNKNKKPQKAE